MTRFARAKGSKSSNDRLPNEATPWHLMKEQLVANLSNVQERKDKAKSAKQLLEEKEIFYHKTVGNVNTDWAQFEDVPPKKKGIDNATKTNEKEKKSSGKSMLPERTIEKNIEKQGTEQLAQQRVEKEFNEVHSTDGVQVEETTTKFKQKQKLSNTAVNKANEIHQLKSDVKSKQLNNKRKRQNTSSMGDTNLNIHKKNKAESDEKEIENTKFGETARKKKKIKDISNTLKKVTPAENISTNVENDKSKPVRVTGDSQSQSKLSKRQKRNMKLKSKKNNINNTQSSNNSNMIEETQENNTNYNRNMESTLHNNKQIDNNQITNNVKKKTESANKNDINKNGTKKRKTPKIRDDKEHKRRKVLPESKKIVINGMEIEIVMYDGFPVKKEDAERLIELKQKMIMNGIPKSEVATAMKLERRKAERTLTRIRKLVCYHCRKSGHNLSDCPELGAEQAGTGICFKCGSTEHTHFECKVTKSAEYRHATCFICREQGHIAKQCPDNPKGIYPHGGACKICGDVTHLKKDCPDLAQQKEEAVITVDTIASNNLESIEDKPHRNQSTDRINHLNKVVKF